MYLFLHNEYVFIFYHNNSLLHYYKLRPFTALFKVDEEEVIIVNVPSYLEKFSKYIQQTPDRVQANYMLWRAAAASMKYLTEDARKISLKFLKKLTGKTEETSR